MALDDDQRAWLGTALQNKGRFTRKKTVESDWEDYRRRRAKTATLLEGIPYDSPAKGIVTNGLAAADALAQAGKFADAYKSLSTIKAQAKAGTSSRAPAIAASALNGRAAVIDVKLGSLEANADFALTHFDDLVTRLDQTPTYADQPSPAEARQYLDRFIEQEEPLLLGDLANRQGWISRVGAEITQHDIGAAIAAAEAEILTYQQAGFGAAIQAEVARIAALKQRSQANGGRYLSPDLLKAHGAACTKKITDRILTIRRNDKDSDVTPDAKTDYARGVRLEAAPLNRAFDQVDQNARSNATKRAMRKAGLMDAAVLADTSRGNVRPVPELRQFDPAFVFDDLLPNKQELPDDLPYDQAEALIVEARQRMNATLATMDAKGPALVDLLLKDKDQLALMCSKALTGLDSAGGYTASHAACFARMAEQLREEILASSPSRMADDKSSITIGGVQYDVQGQLGKSKATVRRYVDPLTGKAVAVKSVEASKAHELVGEMKTHMRLMDGNADEPGADNLLKMECAAVGADGSLHMVMEVAEGGDLEKNHAQMRIMEDAGVLPRAARNALAVDMLRQTAMGMKVMEARGLVHNDMKPANVLLTRDGTVKIMDFGESRIADDQGEIASASKVTNTPQAFGTTGAYSAPEQRQRKNKVSAKVDSYALGGMIKVLGLDVDADEGLWNDAQKPVGAIGRLAEALREKDPNKRPSIDAVLMSSYMTSTEEEHPPEDVADLKAASVRFGMAMSGTKTPISTQDFQANSQSHKVSAEWGAYYDDPNVTKLATPTYSGDIPIGMLKGLSIEIDEALKELRKKPAENKAAIDDLLRKRAFWEGKIGAALEARRDAGKQEMAALAQDTVQTLDVPGHGTPTVKDALALRESLQGKIKELQARFYATLESDPAVAATKLNAVNGFLLKMDGEIKAIDAGIEKLAGPDAKFYLAEQKLVEVSARFAPRRPTQEQQAETEQARADAEARRRARV